MIQIPDFIKNHLSFRWTQSPSGEARLWQSTLTSWVNRQSKVCELWHLCGHVILILLLTKGNLVVSIQGTETRAPGVCSWITPWHFKEHREMVFRLDKNLPPIKNVKGKVVSTRKQWEKKKEKATYTLYLYVRLSQRRGGRQGGSRKSGLGQLFICSWLPGVSGWSFSICHYSSLEVLGLPACVFRTGWKRERESKPWTFFCWAKVMCW